MGYHKNEIIAGQVEVGDRIPAPRPATSHVAFPERRLQRKIRQDFERSLRRDMRAIAFSHMFSFILGALTVASAWILVVIF